MRSSRQHGDRHQYRLITDSGTASWGTSADSFLAIEALGRTIDACIHGTGKVVEMSANGLDPGAENDT